MQPLSCAPGSAGCLHICDIHPTRMKRNKLPPAALLPGLPPPPPPQTTDLCLVRADDGHACCSVLQLLHLTQHVLVQAQHKLSLSPEHGGGGHTRFGGGA